MREITKTVYNFSELSKEVREKVIKKWYENEDYPFLSSDIKDELIYHLDENGIQYNDIKVYYSLGYCQGDGLCFIGDFEYNEKRYFISHNNYYYYAESVNITEVFYDENDLEVINELSFRNDADNDFLSLYLEICRKLEKFGYAELEYRMTIDEFTEHAEINNYEYYENGEMI